jgi:hypothetical protein
MIILSFLKTYFIVNFQATAYAKSEERERERNAYMKRLEQLTEKAYASVLCWVGLHCKACPAAIILSYVIKGDNKPPTRYYIASN